MKILITGGSGFVGRAVVRKLLNNYLNVKDALENYDISYNEKFDIRNADLFNSRLNGVDLVVHIAAQANFKQMTSNVSSMTEGLDINVNGTSIVALACAQRKIPLVFASTMCVYGETGSRKVEDCSILAPANLYASSKLMGEQLIKACVKEFKGFSSTILRFGTVYGPGQRPEMGCSIFIENALQGKDIPIETDLTYDESDQRFGRQERRLIYIDDLASAILNAISFTLFNRKNECSVINLCGDQAISAKTMAQDILTLTDSDSVLVPIGERKNQVYFEDACNRRMKEILNFYPKTQWIQGLAKTIKYHDKNIK